LAIRARALQARYRLATLDPTVTPIAKGALIVDMPDSLRSGAGIPIAVGGGRIAFDPAFRGPERPSVVITAIEGAQAGDWPDVTNVDRTGFDITIRNGVTAQSGRAVDYHARGYGAVAA
jgi:hypothetical protein